MMPDSIEPVATLEPGSVSPENGNFIPISIKLRLGLCPRLKLFLLITVLLDEIGVVTVGLLGALTDNWGRSRSGLDGTCNSDKRLAGFSGFGLGDAETKLLGKAEGSRAELHEGNEFAEDHARFPKSRNTPVRCFYKELY